MTGAACPDLAYPNHEDWGFAKVKLDKRSLATVNARMQDVEDPFLRTMLWDSLWESVRDGELPLDAFIAAVAANMPQERDDTVLADVLRKSARAAGYLARMQQPAPALEQLAWQNIQARGGERDLQRHWLDLYLSVADSEEARSRMAALLDGRAKLPGIELDQSLRWRLVRRLNMLGVPGSDKLIDAERARDQSDSGESAALAARVGRPDARVKASWLKLVSDPDTTLSFARVRTAMSYLYPVAQGELSEQTAALRLDQLPELEKRSTPLFMRHYLSTMLPATCTPGSVARLAQAITTHKDLSANTRKALMLAKQEDERCVALQAAMAAASR